MFKRVLANGLFKRMVAKGIPMPIAFEVASANYPNGENVPTVTPRAAAPVIHRTTEGYLDKGTVSLDELFETIWGCNVDAYFEKVLGPVPPGEAEEAAPVEPRPEPPPASAPTAPAQAANTRADAADDLGSVAGIDEVVDVLSDEARRLLAACPFDAEELNRRAELVKMSEVGSSAAARAMMQWTQEAVAEHGSEEAGHLVFVSASRAYFVIRAALGLDLLTPAGPRPAGNDAAGLKMADDIAERLIERCLEVDSSELWDQVGGPLATWHEVMERVIDALAEPHRSEMPTLSVTMSCAVDDAAWVALIEAMPSVDRGWTVTA